MLSELELVQHRLAMHLGRERGDGRIYMQAQDVVLQMLEHRNKECAVCACPTWIEVEDGL